MVPAPGTIASARDGGRTRTLAGGTSGVLLAVATVGFAVSAVA
jgi:hypothetical protein